MLLAIDIGNTNIEFGVFSESTLQSNFRLTTNHDMTSDEVGLFLCQFFHIHDIQINQIQDVIITSVVPQVIYSVRNAMRKYLHRKPLIVGENFPIPMANGYQNPTEVGSDRLVNAYAGFKKYGGGLIVVDFGTATTFDVVSQQGTYLGGVIYPGIKISLDALAVKASKLPKIEIGIPKHVIGINTPMSMQSGLLYGYSGAVIHIIDKIHTQLGYETTIIGTGGLARFISTHSSVITHLEPTLTLEGLQLLYQQRSEPFRPPGF